MPNLVRSTLPAKPRAVLGEYADQPAKQGGLRPLRDAHTGIAAGALLLGIMRPSYETDRRPNRFWPMKISALHAGPLALAWLVAPLCILVVAAQRVVAQTGELELLGTWVVNIERTRKVQPDNANVRWWEGLEGNFSTSVSVGGVPVPMGGGAKPEGDAGIPNPEMLRCQSFSIEPHEHGLLLSYQGVGEEKIRPGAYRGLHSTWSSKTLKSNYESTTRKVKRTLEIQRDGSLLMSVTINPRKGKTRRFKRVFERGG